MASTDSAARWWTRETVAVVTGGNKGIGLAIVRKLAQEAGLTVVLAALDEERGLKATQDLHNDGLLNVVFRKLDISKPESAWIKHTSGGLDIPVNNAAVLHLDNAYEHAVECIDTNYYGTKSVTETLLPHLKASRFECDQIRGLQFDLRGSPWSFLHLDATFVENIKLAAPLGVGAVHISRSHECEALCWTDMSTIESLNKIVTYLSEFRSILQLCVACEIFRKPMALSFVELLKQSELPPGLEVPIQLKIVTELD